jgi:hypothetical protein
VSHVKTSWSGAVASPTVEAAVYLNIAYSESFYTESTQSTGSNSALAMQESASLLVSLKQLNSVAISKDVSILLEGKWMKKASAIPCVDGTLWHALGAGYACH